MELSQSEALGAIDEHDGRIGYVDADFDDTRRHQEVDISLLKGLHDGFLFFAGHAAMDQAAGAFLEEFMAQLFIKGRSRPEGQQTPTLPPEDRRRSTAVPLP